MKNIKSINAFQCRYFNSFLLIADYSSALHLNMVRVKHQNG